MSGDPGSAIGAWLLILVGALMVALCGGCTVFIDAQVLPEVLRDTFSRGAESSYDEGWAQLFLFGSVVVGWLPTLLGAALLTWGLRWRRRASDFKRRPAPMILDDEPG